jgi:hypothetical protein
VFIVFAVVVMVALAFAVLIALGIVAALVWALVSVLLVAAAAAGVALAVAIATSLIATGGTEMLSAAGTAIGIMAFFLALGGFAILRSRQRSRRLTPASRARIDVAATVAKPAEKAAPSRDPALDAAFETLARNADGARLRLAVAQESCRLFLVLADRFPADSDGGDLAVRIRRRVPEHVDECLKAIESATGTERRHYLDETVKTLETVGAEAERHRQRLQVLAAHELDLQRQHLTRGSAPAPLSALD